MIPQPKQYGEIVSTDDGEGTKFLKYGQNVSWDIGAQPQDLNGRFIFLHTCTADLSNKQLYVTEGNKEFGPGFYTTCGDNDKPYELIAGEWFESKQGRHDWHVVAFCFRSAGLVDKLLENAGEDHKQTLTRALSFYLSNSTGYPSGQQNPTQGDLDDINAINLLGRVLIFPANKDTQVSFAGGESKSWTQFTASKSGGGPYWLVIGPQQPLMMLDYRQYAWCAGWGIFCINSCLRYYKFRNYQIFGKDAGQYRAPLTDTKWPGNHPKTKPDGNKFT